MSTPSTFPASQVRVVVDIEFSLNNLDEFSDITVGILPGNVTCDECWGANIPPCGQTNTCDDNITLPKTSFAGGKKSGIKGLDQVTSHVAGKNPSHSPSK